MHKSTAAVVIGVDVGTSGVRTVAANEAGEVLAEAEADLIDSTADGSKHEQNPNDWWRAVCQTTRSTLDALKARKSPASTVGIAFASTSGSLVLTDAEGSPVRSAILYDDTRGASITVMLGQQSSTSFAGINSSYSLVKAAWVRKEEPRTWEKVRRLLHPTDWLTGRLTGQFETTDYSNALKLGYEADVGNWSGAVSSLGISTDLLPRVVSPGTEVGAVSTQASEDTGLPPGVPVFAGLTDGLAALIASGACEPGDANTNLGTTIVWKVLSEKKPQLGAGMYCHRHPAGLWAPGAASNAGPGSIRVDGGGLTPAEMDRLAVRHLPSATLCYVLGSRGERFPFLNAEAKSFVDGDRRDVGQWQASQLQSLAFTERWGYERLEQNGTAVRDSIYSTGRAATSPVLSQLRANVLRRIIKRCQHPTSAFGAAILSSAGVFCRGSLREAIRRMTHVCEGYQPDLVAAQEFERIYNLFRAACARRGYV